MNFPSLLNLYESLFGALRNDEALSGKVVGIFDDLPTGQTEGPYLVFGDTNAAEGRNLDDSEKKIFVRVHIWSSYRGRKEVLEVADLLEAAMPEEFFFEALEVLRDDESGWWHGVVTLRAYVQR